MIKGLYPKQCLCSIITMDRHKLSQLHSVTFTGQYNERKDNMFHLSCGNSLLTIVFELTGLSGARHPLLFPHQPDSGSKQPFRNSITQLCTQISSPTPSSPNHVDASGELTEPYWRITALKFLADVQLTCSGIPLSLQVEVTEEKLK